MKKKNNNDDAELMKELLAGRADEALLLFKEANKLARKRNSWAKRQCRQSKLNYEQAERQYLIEKSSLQPSFRLSAMEFLTCEPDFLNDPELASEAKFLSDRGIGVDQRILKLSLQVKGEADYMRPSMIIGQLNSQQSDDLAYSMTELLYFVALDTVSDNSSFPVYFVYRDKTTLPVIHKYQLSLEHDSALRRWRVDHLDTIFVSSHKNIQGLNSSLNCAALFSEREEK